MPESHRIRVEELRAAYCGICYISRIALLAKVIEPEKPGPHVLQTL
jgi:hypothetical protein